MSLQSHLRTLFTASFIAVAIAACGGGGSGGEASEENNILLDDSIPDEILAVALPESGADVGVSIFSNDNVSFVTSPARLSHISQNVIEDIYGASLIEEAQDVNHSPYQVVTTPFPLGIEVGVMVSMSSRYDVEGIYITSLDGQVLEEC